MVSFVRSISIIFQGVWMSVMGVMLWTPGLIPKGCFINFEVGHKVVRCHEEEALVRAKSLVNLLFCWVSIGMMIVCVVFYLVLDRVFVKRVVEYSKLMSRDEEDEVDESKKVIGKIGSVKDYIGLTGKDFATIYIEK